MHNQIDLMELSEQLVGVVQETMQPAYVSLWLLKPVGRGPESVLPGQK